jgi:hypothetical protein
VVQYHVLNTDCSLIFYARLPTYKVYRNIWLWLEVNNHTNTT